MNSSCKDWTLDQWLDRLENRNQHEIQLGLSRISTVAQQLNLLSPQSRIITVAGTNGKGSTVSALEMIYHKAGYRVGTYTSPHLLKFNERIRVNTSPISDEDLSSIFWHIDSICGLVALTYFEMTTLAALFYFKQKNTQIILLEVGLGGRLDACNCIDPDLAIITTIDFDHQDYLGDSLEKIGYEKAGILRRGIPFIYADTNPPQSIIKKAQELKALTWLYSEDYNLKETDVCWEIHYLDKVIKLLTKPKIQLKSAAAAVLASQLLAEKLPVTLQQLQMAMEAIHVPGRLQLQPGPIKILYDVSHNPQSARLLAQYIGQLEKAKVHAVFSALKDKDILAMLLPLKAAVDHWYLAKLESKRASDEQFLIKSLKDAEIFVNICYNTPLMAFEAALRAAKIGDLIVVFGSFLTVSHVMAAQLTSKQQHP